MYSKPNVTTPGPVEASRSSDGVISNSAWQLRGVRVIGVVVLIVASMVIVGWAMRWPRVVSLLPGLPAMQFSTALSLWLLGISLSSFTITVGSARARRLAITVVRLTSVLSGLIACLSLLEMASGRSLGVPDWFSTGRFAESELQPGPMSPATAVSIFLLSLSMLLSSVTDRRIELGWLAIVSALSASAIGALAGVSMLMLNSNVVVIPFFATMAIHTAWLVFVLGAGVLLARRAQIALVGRNFEPKLSNHGVFLTALVIVAFGVGICVTVLATGSAARRETEAARARFDRIMERIVVEAQRRAYLPVYGLKGARGMYAGSERVSRTEFSDYVASRDLPGEFPGTIGIGFVQRVHRSELEAFLMRERADAAPDYTLKSSGDRETFYPITRIEPIESNLPALGYDIGSEPNRREAVEHAIRSGEPTLTRRITLVQDERARPGFLFLVPIYENGKPTSTAEERSVALDGVVYSAMVIDEMFIGLHEVSEGVLSYRVYEGNAATDDTLLFEDAAPAQAEVSSRFRALSKVKTGGQVWTIETSSTPEFDATVISPQVTLTALYGLGLSTVVSCFIWAIGGSRARALEIAEQMTFNLKCSADELRLLNNEVEKKNAELSAMAERAHHVVDDVSHEFRTPLSVIKEFCAIVSEGLAGPVTEDQAKYLKIVDVSVLGLNQMVEDFLDSSKLRAGRLRVLRRGHSVESIFAGGRDLLARKASARSIVIEECVAPGLPHVFADEEKVRRVISNLMTNAIKFSPEGGVIRLSASRSQAPGLVTISVTDQGAGLSKPDIDQLFGRFRQVSTSRNVAAKGFGLGLSIAQELSWLNLGSLSVESVKGEGATFSFTLPEWDRCVVLESYATTLAALDRPAHQLAVLSVKVTDPEGSEIDEDGMDTMSFLASTTMPTDLILPADSRRPFTEQREWWIVGQSSKPDVWVERIRTARRELVSESPRNLAALSVDLFKVWSYPNEIGVAIRELELTMDKEPHHAA